MHCLILLLELLEENSRSLCSSARGFTQTPVTRTEFNRCYLPLSRVGHSCQARCPAAAGVGPELKSLRESIALNSIPVPPTGISSCDARHTTERDVDHDSSS